MEHNLIVLAYCIYLATGVFVTYWVGKSLYRNGEVFLHKIFEHKPNLVEPVNKLLLTGYYLLNMGYVFMLLVQRLSITTPGQLLEILSFRIGLVLVTLGVMHCFNLLVFFLISRKFNSILHN